MGTKAVDVRVRGRVQGVSFRMCAEQRAAELGVVGWVRNEPDGSLAAQVEGDEGAVDAFVDWCRQGPPYARVEGVETGPVPVTGATSFRVRY